MSSLRPLSRFIALKALSVKAGDKSLTSTFTLEPVPGAITHVGADVILIEASADYLSNLSNLSDLTDLERKAATSGAKVFLLSHIRGHITDLPTVRTICDKYGFAIIEDCAHTMGPKRDDEYTGTWGKVGCYRAQTHKHINSGECGLPITDDDEVAAQAILMSGCYMVYDQQLLKPSPDVFERWKYVTPNFSMCMSK